MSELKTQAERGQRLLPGDERRRSQRVVIRVPVTLHLTMASQAVAIRAATVAVNDHGAMLLCARSLPPETKFQLQNEHTRERADCRVTRTPRETPDGFMIPVEFAAPSADFWHISFPPPDWRSSED